MLNLPSQLFHLPFDILKDIKNCDIFTSKIFLSHIKLAHVNKINVQLGCEIGKFTHMKYLIRTGIEYCIVLKKSLYMKIHMSHAKLKSNI